MMAIYRATKYSCPLLLNRIHNRSHFLASETAGRLGRLGEVEATSISLPLTCPLSKH